MSLPIDKLSRRILPVTEGKVGGNSGELVSRPCTICPIPVGHNALFNAQ